MRILFYQISNVAPLLTSYINIFYYLSDIKSGNFSQMGQYAGNALLVKNI